MKDNNSMPTKFSANEKHVKAEVLQDMIEQLESEIKDRQKMIAGYKNELAQMPMK